MIHRFGKAVWTVLLLGLVLYAGAVRAQPYPSKPIRLIIPFAAGSATDTGARIIAQKLSEALKQQVIVEPRPGANGIIAVEAVAKATPDGYTIVLASNGTHGINVSLFDKLPYDPVKDFAPIARVGNLAYFLTVSNSLPVNSVKELVALAKANPGKRTLGSTASVSQLTGELFKLTTGIEMTNVPYKSPSPALIDLASGQLDALFDSTTTSLPHIKSGRIKVLGVTSAKRSMMLPDAPTIAESGYPGFESTAWTAFFAPAGTPKEIIDKLHSEIVRVLQMPEVAEKLLNSGYEVVVGSSEQLGEEVKAEVAKWVRVFKAANIPKAN